MSGPNHRIFIAISLACVACVPRGALASTTDGAADSTSSFAGLKTEWTFDREMLSAAGIRRPSRLAYDSDGNLHVLDAETRRVIKLDPRGRVLYEVGGYGSDETSLELPVDIAVDRDQSLLVLDRGRGALLAFDRAGRFLAARPFQGEAAEEARAAGARILLDRFGKLWLLSSRERDLLPLDNRLGPARATRFLTPEDSLRLPVAAAIRPGGGVWVCDAPRAALRRFGPTGRFERDFVLDPEPGHVSISDLAVGSDGLVFAADAAGQRILVFEPERGLLLVRPLGGPTRSWRPGALALGTRGQVAVADGERDEIQVLTIGREVRP